MSEQNTATPAVPEGGTPPAAPAATPVVADPEKVTLDKAAHDQLVKDAARASSAQSKVDRYENILKKNGLLGGGHFQQPTPVTPPTQEERQAAGVAEDEKAKSGLLSLALDPVYRDVLDKDPTLRDLFTKNPLSVLSILAPDALDADDAMLLVREALNKRRVVPALATPPASITPPTPPVGGVNPQDKAVNEDVEKARKMPNTESAVAGMIGAKLRGMKK